MLSKILMLILILFGQNLQAQTEFKVHLGCKAGYQHSVIDALTGDNQPTGFVSDEFYAGFWMEKSISKRWNFSPEILYSSAVGVFNYVELPILFDYKFGKKWRAFLGPKIEIIVDNYTESEDYYIYHITPAAEGGIKYQMGKRWIIEARYGMAFWNQIEDYQLDVLFGKRRTLRLGFGYAF